MSVLSCQFTVMECEMISLDYHVRLVLLLKPSSAAASKMAAPCWRNCEWSLSLSLCVCVCVHCPHTRGKVCQSHTCCCLRIQTHTHNLVLLYLWGLSSLWASQRHTHHSELMCVYVVTGVVHAGDSCFVSSNQLWADHIPVECLITCFHFRLMMR